MKTMTAINQDFLQAVRDEIKTTLAETVLARSMETEIDSLLSGKMLRTQLMFTLGNAIGTPKHKCLTAAAAVEMLHAASLLHDDVVDGGQLRRGAPALWVTHGPKVAVLTGDMLLSLAFAKMARSHPYAVPALATTLQDMCDAEIEQEFADNHKTVAWDDCIRIARGKTGSLFGFTAYCAAGEPSSLADDLAKAGTQLGVAYQLADDLLDLQHNEAAIGKTLGTDAASGKNTAATLLEHTHQTPASLIQPILDEATNALAAWPLVQQALQTYIHGTLQPLIETYTTA